MTDVATVLAKLPPQAFTVLLSDPCQVIAIKRGVSGYYPVRRRQTPEDAKAFADHLNHGAVSAKQLEAMEIGSMFGWEVPGADPDNL